MRRIWASGANGTAAGSTSRGVSLLPPEYGIAFADHGAIQAKAGVVEGRPAATRSGQLPSGLRAGIEALSGLSMHGVRVHHDSPCPRQVRAQAFTRGQDIFLGPGQGHHLPHEAWHVVQQMQGRVGATSQIAGAAINDSASLESEADRMGARARDHHVAGPAPAMAPRGLGSASGSASSVVQRKVGFEFEMNWNVKAPGNTIGMHQAIVEGTNWEATPDMAAHPNPLERHYTGWGNLEYVTGAFDESLLGRGRLETTLDEIVELTNSMAGRWGSIRRPDDSIHLSSEIRGPVRWAAATPQERRNDILIVRNGDGPTASPQMTAGIRLENLPGVFTELGQAPQVGVANTYGRDPTAVGGVPSAARARIAQVHARATQQAALVQNHEMNATQRRIYEGAIAHIALIVALGQLVDVGTNEKYLSPLLSRTNFGDLPPFVRRHPTFKADVLIASGRATIDDWGTVRDQQLFSASPGMAQRTIDSWLTAIRNGNDPLRWGREGDLNRWLPQQVGSLPNRSIGHVFEFRGVSNELPVAEWKDWALAQFDHVRLRLNA